MENSFGKLIKTNYMLITAGSKDNYNTMTASWGLYGNLWEEDCIMVFVRDSRYTLEFLNNNKYFSISLFKDNKDKLSYLGSVSGRDEDKIKNSGFNVLFDNGVPYINEGFESIILEKVFVSKMEENNFIDHNILDKFYTGRNLNDYHNIFVGKVIKTINNNI